MDFMLSRATRVTAQWASAPVQHAVARFWRDMEMTLSTTGFVPDNRLMICLAPALPPESYTLDVTENQLTLCAADDLGAVYGLLDISRHYLGVAPFWFWNQQQFEPKPFATVPEGRITGPAAAVGLRGWDLSDAPWLSAWADATENGWEMIFESLLRSRGMEAAGDFGLNLTNSRAASELRDLGLCSLTASFELTLPQLRDLSKPLPTEMLVYGRLPLMLTENCLIRNRTGECSCGAGPVKLIDRKGEEFRIVRDCGTCRSVVLNGKKLYLLDKREDLRRFGLWALRLSFTTENPGEIDTVLSNLNAPFDPGACTRGLYYRGVE